MKKNYSVTAIESFRRDARKLIKKYRSISNEITALSEALSENPTMGTSSGNGVFKVRLRIASKQKGRAAGRAGDYLREGAAGNGVFALYL